MISECSSEPKKSDALPSLSATPGPGMLDSQTRSEGETPRYSRGRLSRGKGLRKTTGCLTCRRRHVKCDEGKPRCGPCAKRRVSCSYASTEDRRQSQTPRHASSRDGASDRTATPAARVPESTVSEPMGPPRMVALVSSAGERDDRHDQGLGMDTVVSPEAEWTEDSGSVVRDRAAHPGGSFNGDMLAAGGQYEFHAIETNHTHPSASRAAGPDSLDGISSLPYGVRSPAPLATYQAHCQFTGYPVMPVESPTTRWLDLLIGDATIQNGPLPDWEYDSNGLDVFGNSMAQSPVSHSATLSIPLKQISEPNSRLRHPFSTTSTSSGYLRERIPYVGNQKREELAWKAIEPIELQPHETVLFRHYTDHISLWLDLFDPCRPFGTYVPHLAMHSVGLMNAILALSARHLSLTQQEDAPDGGRDCPDPNDAVDYYLKTLHYSQRALQYDTYKTSPELLAISIIVSSYEMLGGSSANWGKHLEGVFWIQRSQVIHGDTGGLRQAVWWTWLCQDVWAAFREKRKPFTFWAPSRTLAELNPVEIAARSVYNYAKVVGFCSADAMGNGRDVSARTLEADVLLQQLEEWRTYLTLEFDPLPSGLSRQDPEDVFPPVWIQPSVFAVSMQLYYCSLILVHLQRPMSGGLDDHLERRTVLRDCAKMVCGIARTLTDYASSIMSSQCLFIAGMTLEDEKQRNTVLDLLNDCQKRGGWPSLSLGHDLSQIWKRSGH